MVTRETGLSELGMHTSNTEQPQAGLPLSEHGNEQAGNGSVDTVGRDIAAKLLKRIHEANPDMGKRAKDAKVTVVIPAYLKDAQDLTWLVEALESVLDQSEPCKVIIVENGSNYLSDLEGPISIIHSVKGLSAARNAGFRKSTTEFVFPMDCNDWIPDNALELLVRRYPGSGFIYGSTMLFRYERGAGDQHLYEAKPYDFKEVMKMVYFTGALQRKSDWEIIGGYREDLPFLEDWDYWMTAGERGICGTPIPDTIYWYRQHSGMVVSNKKSPEWDQVRKRIQNLHINLYQGRYPDMCCGRGSQSNQQVNFSQGAAQILAPGAEGMVLLEYTGANAGNSTYYGAVSKQRYKAGGITKKFYVDSRDVQTFSSKNPGFLEMMDHGNYLFKLAEVVEEEVPA